MTRRMIALVSIVVLGGCTLGPAYERPEVPVPEEWREGPTVDESAADVEWWNVFRDETLQELIGVALEENKDLRIAAERIEQARAQYGISEANLWPRADVSAGAGVIDPGDFLPAAPGAPAGSREEVYSVSFDVGWEIDVFGRLRRANEAAWASYLATEQARRAVTLTLVSEVARAYFELRDLDKEIEITRATLESRGSFRDLVKVLYQGGVRSELDYRQAEAEYYRVEITLRRLERAVTLKENELSILLGRNPGPLPRGAELADQQLPAEIPAGIPSSLLERRPDVMSAEQQLVAANARIGEAKALLFPVVALTGSFGGASTELSDVFNSSQTSWNLIGGLLQPIFNAGQNRRRVEVTESQQRQALLSYEAAVQQAFREVEDALVSYDKISRQLESQNARVSSLREVLRLSSLRYEGGVAAYLEVLDAQRSLFDAELAAVQIQRDQLVALTRLYKALGGGWSEPSSD